MAGYGDDAGFSAWLVDNGYTLPAEAPEPAVLRNRGANVIDSLYGSRFVGEPTGGFAQERAWPRTGAYALGQAIPDDLVPDAVIKASYHAALGAIESTGESTSIGAADVIKRDKVGDSETEFADLTSAFKWGDDVPISLLDGLLAPFLRVSLGFGLWSIG